VAALLLSAAPLAAQTGTGVPTQPPAARDSVAPSGSRQTSVDGEEGPLLDAPVGRSYVLGAGDRVAVAIFGDFNHLYTLPVGPEGTVVIPSVGIATVGGLNLEQAEQRVRQVVARYYRNVDVHLSLSQVRSFKVYVVGDVERPGVRVATAATRVSEVVGGTARVVEGVRRRNVTLRRAGGETVPVDLIRFNQLGDVSANPTLREGDALVVPTIDERVEIFGRVQFPGGYEYRSGESLADLLFIANGAGGFPSGAADTLRVTRFEGNHVRRVIAFSREDAMGERGRAFILQPSDGIYVPTIGNFRVQRTAIITGQVARPGTYPIRQDTTTVRELVAMAGGFTSDASLVDASLRRAPNGGPARDELANVPPELLTDEDRRIIQVRNTADPTRVVVNFQELFAAGGNAFDQTLRSGDVLTVPPRRVDVAVLGAVREPGLVPHRPGAEPLSYVTAAGGLARRADRRNVVVLRASTGSRVPIWEVGRIEPGDAVIVPFRRESSPLTVLQYSQAIVATVTGAILAAVAVFK
jgi:protein involved in polysaccharide export with SLBB domain